MIRGVTGQPASDGGLDRRVIGVASIAYVTFPLAIWMVGWLKPTFAVIGMAALLMGAVSLAFPLAKSSAEAGDRQRISWTQAAAICLAVGVFVGLNGVGGFGVQTSDWLKHNAMLSDLINQPWPVAYRTSAGEIALVYYVAYYLPAALVGKLFGWAAANLALFVWTVFGGVLAVLWIVILTRAPVWLCLLGFVFFSGLDVVGGFLVAPANGRWTFWINNRNLEWWEGHWVFPSNQSLIAYVPQQALGGWLLTGLAIDRLQRSPVDVDYPYLLPVALSLMWSPYAAVGLGLLSVLLLAASGVPMRQLIVRQFSVANLAGAIVGAIFAIYFLSRSAPVQLAAPYVSPPSAFERGAFAVGLHDMSLTKFAAHYGSSVLLEFLLLAGVLAFVHRGRPTERRLLAASACILLALPFFNHGHYNDFVMRVSIPPLFALMVLTLQALASSPSGAARTSVAALLIVGALHPANMLRLNARQVWRRGALQRLPPVVSLFQLQREVRGYWPYLYQYVCPADAFFFKHMARRLVAVDRDP